MYLKANVLFPEFLRDLIRRAAKTHKTIVIVFDSDKVEFSASEEALTGKVVLWGEIRTCSIFEEFCIKSKASNRIAITVTPTIFLTLLDRICDSNFVVEHYIMRLAKDKEKQHAVLAFDLTGTTESSRYVSVHHEICISVVSPNHIPSIPKCEEPDIDMVLQSARQLQGLVAKISSYSPFIRMNANFNGCLVLEVMSDEVRIKTECKGLKVLFPDKVETAAKSGFSILVLSKLLSQTLSSILLSDVVTIGIRDEHFLLIGTVSGQNEARLFHLIPAVIE
ncbi:hypothetical protein D9757_015028 [Collybiopsis confluens]|uniref:Checkpoint protein n=1 Tax=Collybiopsis confluens TaxID=2823264 RepID=A0A8H5CL19_9AGAR|nr:hypothetical protein D9757_015028 [Collybiopsis confluens]